MKIQSLRVRTKRAKSSEDQRLKTLETFNKTYPTDSHCYREIWKRSHHSQIPICAFCNESNHQFEFDRRTFKCNKCHRKNSVTAGTFFENIRSPRAWLGRLWFLEKGVEVNSAQFAKLFNIASSTSLNMLKKIMMVVVNELSAHSTVNSSEFEDAISRRSAETPVNQHPRSEIQVETSIVEDLVSPLIEKLDVCELGIFKLLEVDKPLSSDQLLIRGALTSGELALSLLNLKSLGLVKFLPGDLYARDKPPAPPICDGAQSSRVLKFTGIIIETYQGISRKYLQLYLCAVWIFTDRKRWGQGSLIAACSKAAEIKDSQVRAYVSPPSVRIP